MNISKYLLGALLLLSITSCQAQSGKSSLLIFSKTEGYRHASIERGAQAVREIAEQMGYRVEHTEDASVFTAGTLPDYSAVVFLNTTGDILNDEQQENFENFIRGGGGFVGIHSATDTEYEWEWYGKMVGGYFNGHPGNPNVREAVIRTVTEHEITKGIPADWKRKDEWYDFRDINPAINVLQKVDENTYKGGGMGDNHPITWFHEYDGGKVFYTGMGHTAETFDEDNFRELIKNAIEFVTE